MRSLGRGGTDPVCSVSVDRDEVDRLRKRFMKLDKVDSLSGPLVTIFVANSHVAQDNSGTIERDEFLSLPAVSSNPLATRYLTFPLSSLCQLLMTSSLIRQYDCYF